MPSRGARLASKVVNDSDREVRVEVRSAIYWVGCWFEEEEQCLELDVLLRHPTKIYLNGKQLFLGKVKENTNLITIPSPSLNFETPQTLKSHNSMLDTPVRPVSLLPFDESYQDTNK